MGDGISKDCRKTERVQSEGKGDLELLQSNRVSKRGKLKIARKPFKGEAPEKEKLLREAQQVFSFPAGGKFMTFAVIGCLTLLAVACLPGPNTIFLARMLRHKRRTLRCLLTELGKPCCC